MEIIDEKLLRRIRLLPFCELCGKEVPTGLNAHHLRARGMGGGSRLDVWFGVAGLCPPIAGNNCHDDLHRGLIPRFAALTAVAYRCKLDREVIEESLAFLIWVPSRPLAGNVAKRFDQLMSASRDLVYPFVREVMS